MKNKILSTVSFLLITSFAVISVIQNNHLKNRDIRQKKITRYFDSCRKYNSISSDILWGIRLDMINGIISDSFLKDRIKDRNYSNEKANLYQDSLENCLKP